MKINIKILIILTIFPCLLFASASRDTYKIDIQRQIQQIDNEIKEGQASKFQKKKKQYLQNRLNEIQSGLGVVTFSSKIVKGKPIDSIDYISYKKKQVYFFTEMLGMRGKYITHVWYFKNKEFIKKRIKIRKSIWNFWTTIKIDKNMVGSWKGIVLNDNGKILLTKSFKITD